MAKSPEQAIDFEPLTLPLDTRSPAREVPIGTWRFVQNFEAAGERELTRAAGWERLLSGDDYNNQDLHDQLTTLSGSFQTQPITFLYHVLSTSNYNRLIAGTSNRLFMLNNATGNWRILSDLLGERAGTGCGDVGWSVGQVGNYLVFTNGLDEPVYHVIGQPPMKAGNQSVSTIDDLQTIGLTQARIVIGWRDFIIFANVVMDGIRVDHRLVWSDNGAPLSYSPVLNVSAAGRQDLGSGETILAMLPINDSLLIYTTMGIWEAFLTGSQPAIGFRKRYSDPTANNRCLVFPRTLVSTGSEHVYFGRDGIYTYNLYRATPERPAWMHNASALIFNNLNSSNCNTHVGGYDPVRKTVWFSWAGVGNLCPNHSMTFHTEFGFSSYVDAGFSAFTSYKPTTYKTLREFLKELCICTQDEMDDFTGGYIKEGGFCTSQADSPCATRPTSIYTQQTRVVDGKTVEDWSAASADPDSICARMAEFGWVTMDDLCASEYTQGDCNSTQLFVGASVTDSCIKQIGTAYSRERCTSTTGCGSYTLDGYRSIIRSGPMHMKLPRNNKLMQRLTADVTASESATPPVLNCRIGAAYEPADPNTDRCNLLWFTQSPKTIQCGSTKTAAQHTAAITRPSGAIQWPLFIENRYLYYELSVDGTPPPFSFSHVGIEYLIKPT